MIWKIKPEIDVLNDRIKDKLVQFIGLKFTQIEDNALYASMTIDENTIQPFGIMNGGVSGIISETVGSIASVLCIDLETSRPVGVQLNVNHLKAIPKGMEIKITCTPIRIGRKLHVWETQIENSKGDLCAVSRLTVMVLEN